MFSYKIIYICGEQEEEDLYLWSIFFNNQMQI